MLEGGSSRSLGSGRSVFHLLYNFPCSTVFESLPHGCEDEERGGGISSAFEVHNVSRSIVVLPVQNADHDLVVPILLPFCKQ